LFDIVYSQVDMFSCRCYRFFPFLCCFFLYCLPFIGELKIIKFAINQLWSQKLHSKRALPRR